MELNWAQSLCEILLLSTGQGVTPEGRGLAPRHTPRDYLVQLFSNKLTPLLASSSPQLYVPSLLVFHGISSPDLAPDLQTRTSSCPLDSATWISSRHLNLNVSNNKFLILCRKRALPGAHPPQHSSRFHAVAQAQHVCPICPSFTIFNPSPTLLALPALCVHDPLFSHHPHGSESPPTCTTAAASSLITLIPALPPTVYLHVVANSHPLKIRVGSCQPSTPHRTQCTTEPFPSVAGSPAIPAPAPVLVSLDTVLLSHSSWPTLTFL